MVTEEKASGGGTYLPLTGMCPQFSLQVMMGVGTPMAWQVKVTVEPLAASTASSGGLVTEGGAAWWEVKCSTGQLEEDKEGVSQWGRHRKT